LEGAKAVGAVAVIDTFGTGRGYDGQNLLGSRGEWQLRAQAVWKRREIAVLPDSPWGEVALES
jgi:hypothetical protein